VGEAGTEFQWEVEQARKVWSFTVMSCTAKPVNAVRVLFWKGGHLAENRKWEEDLGLIRLGFVRPVMTPGSNKVSWK
jgi:hypothetical protein